MQLEPDLPASVLPKVSAERATALATRRGGLFADASRATLAVWPTASGSRLAWLVYPRPIPGLAYAPAVVVDALTADVLTR